MSRIDMIVLGIGLAMLLISLFSGVGAAKRNTACLVFMAILYYLLADCEKATFFVVFSAVCVLGGVSAVFYFAVVKNKKEFWNLFNTINFIVCSLMVLVAIYLHIISKT